MAITKPRRNRAFDNFLTVNKRSLEVEVDSIFREDDYFLVKYDFEGVTIYVTCSLSSLTLKQVDGSSSPGLKDKCVPGSKIRLLGVRFAEKRTGGGYRAVSAELL